MRKILFASIMLAAIMTATAGAIDLWPDTAGDDVSAKVLRTAVVSVCLTTGYAEYDTEEYECDDPETPETEMCERPVLRDPAVVWEYVGDVPKWITSTAWTDNAAMQAWYRERLIELLRGYRARAWAAAGAVIPPDSFEE